MLVCLAQPTTQIVIVEANPILLPHIQIEPRTWEEETYNTSTIQLSICVLLGKNSPELRSVFYSLDGKSNYTLIASKATEYNYTAPLTLENLANGTHTINAYADFINGTTIATGQTFIVEAPNTNSLLALNSQAITIVVSSLVVIIGIALAVLLFRKKKLTNKQSYL